MKRKPSKRKSVKNRKMSGKMLARKKAMAVVREKLHRAFMRLSEAGLVTRENHLCCTTCASHSVQEEAIAKGMDGGIYWHAQDEEHFRECGTLAIGFAGNAKKFSEEILEMLMEDPRFAKYIGTGIPVTEIPGDDRCDIQELFEKASHEAANQVAQRTVNELKKEGLKVLWNGDVNIRIGVSI
jgi:hypothetical protein